MTLKAFINDHRNAVSLTLILVWLLAIWNFKSINSILYPLLAVLTVTACDLVITFFRTKKFYWPFSSFVSGLLIGLILPLDAPILVLIAAAAIASVSKQFVGNGIRQHIFNPAAFGIVAVSFIFGTPVAWWAVSWSHWPLIILVPFMIRILWKLKRLFLPIGFLILYFVFLLVSIGESGASGALFDGTALLFALVMLPEIITSPASGYFKYTFGIIVGIFLIIFSQLTKLTDVFLISLLAANLVSRLWLLYGKINFDRARVKQEV